VDEGLALRLPAAFRMNRARTWRTVLTIHPSAMMADKLLPFFSDENYRLAGGSSTTC
jgi:hypothetical protein